MTLSDALLTPKKAPSKEALGKIAELLERNSIDLDEVGSISRISLWQTGIKNKDGEFEAHDQIGIQIDPAWKDGPQWPVIQPGSLYKLPAAKAKSAVGKWKHAVVFPDMQIGYYRGLDGTLIPIHDEDAISIAIAIAKNVKPQKIILVGDNLDLAELSKYRLTPAYQLTTQAAIDRATRFVAELRAACPYAEIVWLAGNHEERLPNFILDNAKAAFGLKRGESPKSWPVLSVPFLCRFDDYDITYKEGYPASSYWITEKLRVIHGDKVASNGSTSHKYLSTEKTSVIFGHIHRREWNERTREDFDGPKTILAASPGCLCKTGGSVPSTRGGMDLDGRPVARQEDWQQGLAVVPYDEDTGNFVYEQIAIHDGWAMYRGVEYRA